MELLVSRIRAIEPTVPVLALLVVGFVGALFLRRYLPESRRQRGRVSVLLLGLGPIVHLAAWGLGLAGAERLAASLHLANLVVVSMGVTGVLTMALFDVVLASAMIPSIVRDLVQTGVFLALVLGVLHSGGLDPLSVLTTSAVATAVLGLALQNVIANAFAGVVLQVERSLGLGDWIEIGSRVGRIDEIRWRASTLVTRDGDVVLVPNSQLLSQQVVNLSQPTRARRLVVRAPFHHRHAPGEVREVLLAALDRAPGVLADPPPGCAPVEFTGATVVYAVSWWVDDPSREQAVEGEVRQRIWYAASRAGLEGPCPAPVVLPERGADGIALGGPAERAELARRCATVGAVALFAPLGDADREAVARGATRRRYGEGEVILREGEPGDSLFVVERGAVTVRVDGTSTPVARLGPGAYFGEMSLLTGAARHATCVAERDTACLEIGSDSLLALVSERPALADALAQQLAVRQSALDASREGAAHDVPVDRARATLFGRVRAYFHLA